mmetsp:Transcript_69738/g.130208  ORF Transcript_69738/g.130208 Transcript_69738/m.130208 type:complete len:420 (-) Transcript_69738:12-1271(-)
MQLGAPVQLNRWQLQRSVSSRVVASAGCSYSEVSRQPKATGGLFVTRVCLATAAVLQRRKFRRRWCAAPDGKSDGSATNKSPVKEGEDTRTISERFEDFTRVLPWFDFAATILDSHVERQQARLADAELVKQVSKPGGASAAILDAREKLQGKQSGSSPGMPAVVDAIMEGVEEGHIAAPQPLKLLDGIKGRWEVVWGGGFSPLHRLGFARQCLWMEVKGGEEGEPAVLTVHGGLPLVLFGAYTWTSVAGEIVEGKPLQNGAPAPLVLKFNRYWLDIGRNPRPDIGRIDGGLINDRISAFGAALVTPILLELGAVKWFLDRLGLNKVFEVEVPKDDGSKVKLEASLELYLTLLAMVAFPESLSTCPVAFLDAEAGLCVYEIPMLGPLADLPDWAHPGGNAAALVARKLRDDEEPALMLP